MLRAYPVLGNSQRLDGGAMFGNAPRAMWSRWMPPDDQGRIDLACRALLLDCGGQRILFETGIGAYFSPELRERYGVVEERHVLLESLEKIGLGHDRIDRIVLSHLHFDHAGGLLAPYEEGAEPRLLFDNAEFIVSTTAFERAKAPHRRDRASFIPELAGLLEDSGRLRLVRDGVEATALLGGPMRCRTSDGHTPGMLHTAIHGGGRTLFFCADLVPGVPWVHLPITMGYDRFPERLIDEKEAVFSDLCAGRPTWLFFTHDPKVAAARLVRGERGRFSVDSELTDTTVGWDLDLA